MHAEDSLAHAARYPLLEALLGRRSRRFSTGMTLESGPLAHRSARSPLPLTEEEEALLAFAACGVTGPALADLDYTPGGGATIMAGLAGRTAASGDAIQTVSLFVVNDEATYLLRRPRDLEPQEIPQLVGLARQRRFTDLYRRTRIRIAGGRTCPPLQPLHNLPVNRWSLHAPGTTYFLPVNELTFMYINGLLEVLGEPTAAFVVDERRGFRPAGMGRFARSRGGHLHDDPRLARVLTIQQVEGLVTEFVTIEQGMVLQNLALMTEAMGLGGFPHWAAHPWGWLEALGFRTQPLRASRYLGMSRPLAAAARLLGRDSRVTMALGLERDGRPLLVPWCPPWHATMEAAVRAVVDSKFGPRGVFRGGVLSGLWRQPAPIADAAAPPSDAAVDATIAYCQYVHGRYGRFPAYPPPFRTVLGFQAGHVDVEFYDRYYRPEALGEPQRRHMERWHASGGPQAGA